MKLKEYRVLVPLTVEECRIGSTWTIAKVNKDNTGGGEGIVYVKRENFENKTDLYPGCTSGEYCEKIYKIASKLPWFVQKFVPKNKAELHEKNWSSFPYCKSIITHTDKLTIKCETMYADDKGTQDNIFNLPPDMLKKRKVVIMDIANDHVSSKEYKESEDPAKFHSKKTGRGPLGKDWMKTTTPISCVYLLFNVQVKIFGVSKKLETVAHHVMQKLVLVVHRRIFCWMDEWYGLSLEQVQAISDKLNSELNEDINKGGLKGDSFNADDKEPEEEDD